MRIRTPCTHTGSHGADGRQTSPSGRSWTGAQLCCLAAIIALPLSGAAQQPAPDVAGLDSPGAIASRFAPGLVSGAAGDEYGATVSKDWSEIYFTRARGEQSSIMVTRRTGTTWSDATPASFSGQHNDSHPWLAPGGDRLYFVSRRPCPRAQQALNVWVVERSSAGWSTAQSLGRPVTDQTVHAPSVSANGTIYATGLKRLRHVEGRYLPVEPLTPDLDGSHPAVAADESFLVFSGRRRGGLGSTDLYVTFRRPDGSWTSPVNLGPAVNSEHAESSPTLSSDGRFLLFSRQDDIWWVDAAVISAVRPANPQE